jgi:hypothetical protein
MKSRLLLTTVAASLLAVAGLASAQETYRTAQPTAQLNSDPMAPPAMQQNANTMTQGTADTSYGGVPSTRSATGTMMPGRSSTPCVRGPQCDIFFGN